MNYTKFLKTKKIKNKSAGFESENLNSNLFDFQKKIVKWATQKGKCAIFADCGMGKTIMQLEWANQVQKKENKPVLILAPLAVSAQTKKEGDKFGISVNIANDNDDIVNGINITNYEKLHKFDSSQFIGIVLDESSIIKSFTGKFKQELTEKYQFTKYKLACSATPSPNDYEELGNHCEFLNVMSRNVMLSMFFINDAMKTKCWRLKGHSIDGFWNFVGSWAIMTRSPKDIGFADDSFKLPKLNVIPILLEDKTDRDTLFSTPVDGFQEIRKSLKESMNDRIAETKKIIKTDKNNKWLIWCNYNDESKKLANIIDDGVEITGSNTNEYKSEKMMEFANGGVRVLITKPKIAGFGMNWQSCNNVVFCGLNYSYESYYQAVRRCWRFGQKKEVNVYIVLSEKEMNILTAIKEKEKRHNEMANKISNLKIDYFKNNNKTMEYKKDINEGKSYKAILGDSIEKIQDIKTESIDYQIFSPPFSSLYTYSNSERDMGNCKNDSEFYEHYKFLAKEQFRITQKGRLMSFHCMLLPTVKYKDGFIGLKDFRGDLIRIYQDAGFIYHSEVVIWKDPVVAMQRTKARGLLHCQLKKDSARSRQGIPDYIITMLRPGVNKNPIEHTNDTFPVDHWQKIASPIWTDINQSDTLQKASAREEKDEKHICPLQLEVIRRCLFLWSNQGDTVFSPFMGIGSEGYESIKMNRKFIGIELKESYYKQAIKNLHIAEDMDKQVRLF